MDLDTWVPAVISWPSCYSRDIRLSGNKRCPRPYQGYSGPVDSQTQTIVISQVPECIIGMNIHGIWQNPHNHFFLFVQ